MEVEVYSIHKGAFGTGGSGPDIPPNNKNYMKGGATLCSKE